MKKMLGAIVAVVAIFVFIGYDAGYAFFWGKKTKEEPQKTEKQQETKQEAKTEAKKDVKTEAKTDTKAEADKQPVPAVTEEKKVDAKKLEQDRMMRQKKREQVNNSMWDIEISTLSGKEKPKKDALSFENNMVSSEKYSKEGFPATNYTLTVQDDGTTIWETMQTAVNGQILFWRGEIEPKMTSMRGVISKHVSNEKVEDYSFVSQERKGITPKPPKK